MAAPTTPIDVFFSYSHQDEELRDELAKHLSGLKWQGLIQGWHDRQIVAGTEWQPEIASKLETAKVILLLISPDFMASDFCYNVEMTRAMQRHDAGSACVIPIIVRDVLWEYAPFAKLQALPTDLVPVSQWANRDEALKQVTKGIHEAIQRYFLAPPRLAPSDLDPTHLPNEKISYFISLDTYLSLPQQSFPTHSDFEQGLVYQPARYFTMLEKMLHEQHRALIVGPSASGKTVLAIALARQMQEQQHYKVSYRDAAAASEKEWEKWYQLMLAHNYENVLYILDNCHLAPKEINEFCLQWKHEAPQRTQCLFISQPETGIYTGIKSSTGGTPNTTSILSGTNYFRLLADVTLKVQAETCYFPILQQYERVYRALYSTRSYTPVVDDDAALLNTQHAHNLIVSKTRLDSWRESGGRLSDVTQERVYVLLAERYLSLSVSALPALCALRQYEIRIHTLFVDKLTEKERHAQEIQVLERERLLSHTLVNSYGQLYTLELHPALAREIFEAHIYAHYGNVAEYENESMEQVRSYLLLKPPNYLAVYEGLARQKHHVLLQRLLADAELQTCAASQFKRGRIEDTMRYLYRLGNVAPQQAQHLFDALIKDITLSELAKRASRSHLSVIEQIVVYMHAIGQPSSEIETCIELLDDAQLMRQAEQENIQRLYWLLKTLRTHAPLATDALVETITAERLAALCRAKQVNLTMVDQFRKVVSRPFWQRFLHQFSAEDIAAFCNRSSLKVVGIFMRFYYSAVKAGYTLFQEQFLQKRLAHESLENILAFLQHMLEQKGNGKELAQDALNILITVDLVERIVQSDGEHFAQIVLYANTIDAASALHLFSRLQKPEVLQTLLERSSLRSLQLLLRCAALVSRRYLPPLQHWLQETDIQNRLDVARADDLKHFLWNVYLYIDNEQARAYCAMVNDIVRTRHQAAREALTLDDLLLLWNMTAISNTDALALLEEPLQSQLLAKTWNAQIGLGTLYLGIIGSVQPETSIHTTLGLSLRGQEETLVSWLQEKFTLSPYILALVLRGLCVYDETVAQHIITANALKASALHILKEAQQDAITLHSIALLEGIFVWLESL